MKTFSIMEAQHNLARVLRVVDSGQRVGITRRKKLVAKIIPVDEPAPLPDFVARARSVWGKPWKGASSISLLDETRGAR